MTRRERTTLLVVGVLYAAVVIPIGIHKGGDFTYELGRTERLLHGLPLYETGPAKGVWWPPFTALGLVPFALLAEWSLALSKGCWTALNVLCLGWALARARSWSAGWTPIALAVAAVGKPLQSNFEHLNITPILLGLIVAAAADLREGRERRAGAWIGLAAAIKGFPALLLLYLAYRRAWRGCAAGIGVAAGLTLVAVLPYGPAGAVRAVLDWARRSAEGAALGRWGTQSLAGFTFFFHWSAAAVVLLGVACVAAAALALRRPQGPDAAPGEVGLVTILAVLLSPIAWLYYHTLAFPGWVAALTRPAPAAAWARRTRLAVLCVAGVLTSGALTFDLYPGFLRYVGQANYTWGGLILFAALALERALRPPLQPVPRSP